MLFRSSALPFKRASALRFNPSNRHFSRP